MITIIVINIHILVQVIIMTYDCQLLNGVRTNEVFAEVPQYAMILLRF